MRELLRSRPFGFALLLSLALLAANVIAEPSFGKPQGQYIDVGSQLVPEILA